MKKNKQTSSMPHLLGHNETGLLKRNSSMINTNANSNPNGGGRESQGGSLTRKQNNANATDQQFIKYMRGQ